MRPAFPCSLPLLPASSPKRPLQLSLCIRTVRAHRASFGALILSLHPIKLSDGSVRPARIAGRDHTTDVALLRLDTQDDAKNIMPIRLSPAVPMLGSLSMVVAAERGLPTAALGMVSLVGGRWRRLRGGEIYARIELDVRLRHSHQGGVMLDASGDAIGMAVLGPRQVIVIPAATIQRVAARLETHGRIARGYLGVGLQPVKLDDGVGAMVMNIDKAG